MPQVELTVAELRELASGAPSGALQDRLTETADAIEDAQLVDSELPWSAVQYGENGARQVLANGTPILQAAQGATDRDVLLASHAPAMLLALADAREITESGGTAAEVTAILDLGLAVPAELTAAAGPPGRGRR